MRNHWNFNKAGSRWVAWSHWRICGGALEWRTDWRGTGVEAAFQTWGAGQLNHGGLGKKKGVNRFQRHPRAKGTRPGDGPNAGKEVSAMTFLPWKRPELSSAFLLLCCLFWNRQTPQGKAASNAKLIFWVFLCLPDLSTVLFHCLFWVSEASGRLYILSRFSSCSLREAWPVTSWNGRNSLQSTSETLISAPPRPDPSQGHWALAVGRPKF